MFNRIDSPTFWYAPIARRTYWIICICLLLIAVALRLPGLAERSLWLDETYSYFFATRTLADLWHQVPLYETHPPMYYTLLKAWMHVFGDSEAAMRSMSVLASVGSVAVILLMPRLIAVPPFAERVALLAAALLAVNKGSIQYAQQARPYALETLAAEVMWLASILFVLRVMNKTKTSATAVNAYPGRITVCILLGAGAGATLWTHNTATLIVFATWVSLGITALIYGRRDFFALLMYACFAAVVALAIWSPFIPMFIRESRGVAAAFWVQFSWLEVTSAWVLIFGGKLPVLLIGIAAIVGWIEVWRWNRPVAVHALISLLLPYVIVVVVSAFLRPIYIQRLFEWMTPAAMVFGAIGVIRLCRSRARFTVGLAGLVALMLAQNVIFYRTPSEDWRTPIATITAGIQNSDLLVVASNEAQIPLIYYARDSRIRIRTLAIPYSYPALGLKRKYPSNLAAPVIDETDRAVIDSTVSHYARVWFLDYDPSSLYDPAHVVTTALKEDVSQHPTEVFSGPMSVSRYERLKPETLTTHVASR